MAEYKPKVAIVHDWLNGFAGMEQVLTALLEIFPKAPIYTSVYNPETTKSFEDQQIFTTYLQKFAIFRKKHQLAIPFMPQAFESLDLKGYDILISITTGPAKGIITQPDQLHICYNNTPTRYLWKLGGDNRTSGALRSRIAHKLRIWDYLAAQRPDIYLSNSINVQKRTEKIYRRKSEVVYPPVETNKFTDLERSPADYYLSVGRLVGYKKIDLIVEACCKAKVKLKVVGEGPELGLLKKIASESSQNQIELMGRVSDGERDRLYSEAKAFIFASEEDFGIVPVEAMSAGCPVIAYGKGGALETVVDGKTGLYFKEQTADSLMDAIKRFENMTFSEKEIRQQAQKFAKEVFQKQILAIVERNFPIKKIITENKFSF